MTVEVRCGPTAMRTRRTLTALALVAGLAALVPAARGRQRRAGQARAAHERDPGDRDPQQLSPRTHQGRARGARCDLRRRADLRRLPGLQPCVAAQPVQPAGGARAGARPVSRSAGGLYSNPLCGSGSRPARSPIPSGTARASRSCTPRTSTTTRRASGSPAACGWSGSGRAPTAGTSRCWCCSSSRRPTRWPARWAVSSVPPWDGAALDTLDREIRSVFRPDELITPDDVRRRSLTLEQSVLRRGWPTLRRARGRVAFLMDNGPGAISAAYTAGRPNLEGRVLFTNGQPGAPTPPSSSATSPRKPTSSRSGSSCGAAIWCAPARTSRSARSCPATRHGCARPSQAEHSLCPPTSPRWE